MTTRAPEDPRNATAWLRRQLLERGHDDRSIAALVKSGDLVRVRRGAYVEGWAWRALDASGRHGLVARAVLANAGTPMVLSHVSALPEHDAPMWGLDLDEVHVTRLDRRSGRREAGIVQHCGGLGDLDVVRPHGVPVTGPAATVIDLLGMVSTETGLVVANHFLHSGAVGPEELEARRVATDGWPGSLGNDLVLRLADRRVESVGESRALYLFWQQRLPMPKLQHELRDSDGEVMARLDFAWPAERVWVEFDGRAKYGRLLAPGEDAVSVMEAERRREELIARMTGWRCVRLVWADLARPERTAHRIRAMFAAAA